MNSPSSFNTISRTLGRGKRPVTINFAICLFNLNHICIILSIIACRELDQGGTPVSNVSNDKSLESLVTHFEESLAALAEAEITLTPNDPSA